jgi:hypothetical protein
LVSESALELNQHAVLIAPTLESEVRPVPQMPLLRGCAAEAVRSLELENQIPAGR